MISRLTVTAKELLLKEGNIKAAMTGHISFTLERLEESFIEISINLVNGKGVKLISLGTYKVKLHDNLTLDGVLSALSVTIEDT